jgi:hypothetical protein
MTISKIEAEEGKGKDELPRGLGVEGVWSPVAIVSKSRKGKVGLLKRFIKSETKRDFIILESSGRLYHEILEWSKRKSISRRRGKILVYRYGEVDKFMETVEKTKNAYLVVDTSCVENFMEHACALRDWISSYVLNRLREMGQRFILISRGLNEKVLLGVDFPYLVLGRGSYWTKTLAYVLDRKRVSEYLKHDILGRMKATEFIGVEVGSGAYSFLGKGDVEAIKEMLSGEWKGERVRDG